MANATGAIFHPVNNYLWDTNLLAWVPEEQPTAGGGAVIFSAGTSSAALASIVFSNSNGVSFGLNGSTITATVAAGAADGYNIIAAGSQTANTTGTILFQNSNGITFGMSNSSIVTASHNALTSQSNQAISGSNGSFTFQTVTFGNLNGLSFYTSNGSFVGSYTVPSVPAQTNQTLGLYASSQTTGQSSSTTIDARSFTVRGMGVASVGYSAGELIISVPSGGGAGDGVNIIAAGTQTAATTGTVLFQNSNGIIFGMSNSSVVTASHDGLTSQSNQAVSGSNGSFTFQTVTFGNLNNFSFYTSNGSIVGSYTVPTQSNQTGGIYVTAQSTGQSSSSTYDVRTLSIVPDGIISAGWSNGSFRISATQSDQALSGSNGSFTFQTATFGALNGLSFYTSNGSLVGSYTVPAAGLTQLTAYATSNTTQSSTGTLPLSSLIFAGAGIASVGVSNGSIIVSVPAGGGAGDGGVFAGVSNLGNTAGSTGTVSTGNFVLVGGSNITLSQSTGAAGSAATVTINGPNRATLSGYNSGLLAAEWLLGQIGNATFQVQPFDVAQPFQFESFVLPGQYTATSNLSGSATLSISVGIYTRNASTLSLLQSTSGSFAVTNSGTVGSYSLYSGVRHYNIPWTSTLTEGNYWLAVGSRTTTGGAAGMTWSNFVVSQPSTAMLGLWSAAGNATAQFMFGMGLYSATSAAVPGSIALTQINGSANGNLRVVLYQFVSGSF